MADFYQALFDGSGTLASYAAEVGSVTAPAVDLDDGTTVQASPNDALLALTLTGSGGVQFDQSVETSQIAILELPAAPSPDYFLEATVLVSPGSVNFNMYLLLRGRPMAAGGWADALDVYGIKFRTFGNASYTVNDWAASNGAAGSEGHTYTSPADYGAGEHTIKVRVEMQGTTIRYYTDDVIRYTGTIDDPFDDFVDAGTPYVVLVYDQPGFADDPDAWDGDLSTPQLLMLRAGTLPEGELSIFWKDFELTYEVGP